MVICAFIRADRPFGLHCPDGYNIPPWYHGVKPFLGIFKSGIVDHRDHKKRAEWPLGFEIWRELDFGVRQDFEHLDNLPEARCYFPQSRPSLLDGLNVVQRLFGLVRYPIG